MKWIRYRKSWSLSNSDKTASAEEISQELERVVNDPVFRKSENLRNILTFLAQESIAHPGVNHKEHEIATSVLGRPDDFDPRLDSTVRVHTARLRTKLAEYYASSGHNDPVIFDVPKGAYQLDATIRGDLPPETADEAVAEGAHPPSRPQGWSFALLAWLIALCATGIAIYLWMYPPPKRLPPALATFWADFMERNEETILVFSTPPMTSTEPGTIRFTPLEQIPPEQLVETYAGTGEVYGIGALAGLFAEYRRPVRIKRGRLLTWDDARQENLVFVGGPAVNIQLVELPQLQRFRFGSVASGSSQGSSYIEDTAAGTSLPTRYGHSRRPYAFDHAVISLMRRASNRKMLLLAGTTTMGTQAAVDFVVRQDTVKALLTALKVQDSDVVPAFEALLSVKVRDGVPIQSRLIAVHRRK